MGRMTFVLRRLLQLVPTAIGCTIVVFFMIHLIPGDPARTILGIHAPPRAVALLHKQWGLNRPLISQYLLFMDRLLHGNLGQSLYYGGSAPSSSPPPGPRGSRGSGCSCGTCCATRSSRRSRCSASTSDS